LSDPWNPAQYGKFEKEREQPFYDLLAMVRPAPDMRVVDLGCGTGKLTRELHAHLRARETIGIDRSARMLDTAQQTERPTGLQFRNSTIESFPDGDCGYDLIFSNASSRPNHIDPRRPAGASRSRCSRRAHTRGCCTGSDSPIRWSA
jgi:trans-aconitate 2-methyltransferase